MLFYEQDLVFNRHSIEWVHALLKHILFHPEPTTFSHQTAKLTVVPTLKRVLENRNLMKHDALQWWAGCTFSSPTAHIPRILFKEKKCNISFRSNINDHRLEKVEIIR